MLVKNFIGRTTLLVVIYIFIVPSIGVALHTWGTITQSFKFKYLYKSHWILYNMVSIKSPQQFAGLAVTLVKLFETITSKKNCFRIGVFWAFLRVFG